MIQAISPVLESQPYSFDINPELDDNDTITASNGKCMYIHRY